MSGALAYKVNYDEQERYELINGREYMMSRPSFNHIRLEKKIVGLFDRYLKGKTCEAFLEPNVNLSDDDYVIPDVVIVCNPAILNDPWINGVPDLVVEILSPSTARKDRMEKFRLYEKYGVKEYWLVDPRNKIVEVYHLIDGQFVAEGFYHPYTEGEYKALSNNEKAEAESQKMIKVSLYDDFIIDVADVFEDID